MQDLAFQKLVMIYLKNLTNKMIILNERIHKLEKIMMSGFRATGTAFNQTKTCVNALASLQEETMEDLAECSGVIRDATWN